MRVFFLAIAAWLLPAVGAAQGVDATTFSGSDIGAKVNAACASFSHGGTVYIPAGSSAYSFSTPITASNYCVVEGVGKGATRLEWTGGGGSAVSFTTLTRATLRHLTLTTNGGTGTAITLAGTADSTIEDVLITSDTSPLYGPGFSKGITVTMGGGLWSTSNRISSVRIEFAQAAGIAVDRAIDTFINASSVFAVMNSTTSINLLVDSGVSGLYVTDLSTGFGKNGLKVQNTISSYQSPRFLFFQHFLADTTPGGDAILFDATLSGDPVTGRFVSAHFTNCWAAGAGRDASNGQVTAGANGITINGGEHITFMGGRIRSNDRNGVYVNSSNANYLLFQGNRITENNQGNGGDGHGFYILSNSQSVQIKDNFIANTPSGAMKYGVKVLGVTADFLEITGNDLSTLGLGDISNSGTGRSLVSGNAPVYAQRSPGTQHVTFGSSCATAPIAGALCDSTYSWPNQWADNAYTATCNVSGVASGVPIVAKIYSKTPTQIKVTIAALTASAAQANSVDCEASR